MRHCLSGVGIVVGKPSTNQEDKVSKRVFHKHLGNSRWGSHPREEDRRQKHHHHRGAAPGVGVPQGSRGKEGVLLAQDRERQEMVGEGKKEAEGKKPPPPIRTCASR